MALSSAHGANTADRAPITTSTPARALSHSSGISAVVKPLRRRNAAPTCAMRCVGHTTKTGPDSANAETTVSADNAGGMTNSAPPWALACFVAATTTSLTSFETAPCLGCTTRAFIRGDEALCNTARCEPIHLRATHEISGNRCSSMPVPEIDTNGERRSSAMPSVLCENGLMSVIQPPTRRLFRLTRTL